MLFVVGLLCLGSLTFAAPVEEKLLVAAGQPIVQAQDCPFPNGTDVALHYYMCSDHEQFDINDVYCTTIDGKPLYPIDPRLPFVLNLDAYNNGDQIDDNKNDVKIYQYAPGFNTDQCVWNPVPTFGLLNNIDGCDFAHNCPLTHGELLLELEMDLSQYAPIIEVLTRNKPYQLEIHMKNYNPGNTKHEEIACIMAQVELA